MGRIPAHPSTWLRPCREGLLVEPGGFYIDPVRSVERAVVTHGHADHARPGNDAVLTTPETAAVMEVRYGRRAAQRFQTLAYGETVRIGDVSLRLVPAGHVLGSAQVVLEYAGARAVVSGDYKRRPDPTCPPFEPVACDVFVTEATFGLPLYRLPPTGREIGRLIESLTLFPERVHLLGVYGLGKCQRLIALLRGAGYDGPIRVHGGQVETCELYRRFGVQLGRFERLDEDEPLSGGVVLLPQAAFGEAWARRLHDPVTVVASGWMAVRRRARASGIELPLAISDHADWDELCATLRDVAAPEVWITHGPFEALGHYAATLGKRPRPLHLIGYEAEAEA